jgi:hypothetical protein
MTIQYVNTGSGANAGDGDSLRTAFYKINNNFAELSALSGTDSSVIIINAFPPTTSTEGTIWYDTVSGRNFIYYDGFWVDAAPPAVEPINLTTVTSHILPGADLTYDLGSTSSQWRSLYVGSSTIYLGGTALTIDAGSWSLEPGANTVSFTVSQNTSYTMWIRGNIPNGIVVWNATVSLSNSNVPAIGNQYGWYYAEGNNLVLDSIPDQIIGTSGAISSATVVTTSSNVFSFGITNNSSSTQVVNWGYVAI